MCEPVRISFSQISHKLWEATAMKKNRTRIVRTLFCLAVLGLAL